MAAGQVLHGLRTPDTGPRPAAGAPFRRVPRVPTGSGPSEGSTRADLQIQPRQVPFRANETSVGHRKALRVWMRQRIRPTRPTTKRTPWTSTARPTAGTDAPARGGRVLPPLSEARPAAKMWWLHPIRFSPHRSSRRFSTHGNSPRQLDLRGRLPAAFVRSGTRASLFLRQLSQPLRKRDRAGTDQA